MKSIIKLVMIMALFAVGCFQSVAQINTTRMITIGRNALYFEDYVLSIQYFNEVIKAKPYLAEPYLYRALAKLNLDDFTGAENDLSRCIDRNPFMVFAYLYRGIARQSANNFAGAIEDYNKGLEYRPEDRQILINKGIAFVQQKNYDSALVTLNTLVTTHPKLAQAYLTRGSVYAEKGDTSLAFADIEKALSIDKFYAPAYGNRAILFLQNENYADAEKDLNEAIRLEPKQAGYYINRGLTRFYLNNLRGAMDDYNAVITLNPENIIARFNRGLLRAQVGETNLAVEDFNKVIQLEPENFMAIYNRAILNEETGNYADAISDLDRVLEEYPMFVPGYYFKSDLERKMKDVKAADRDYWYAYDLEQKLRKERESGKTVTGRGVFDSQEQADNKSKVREQSDKDIEKFNRLVIYDREDETRSSYTSEIRGRVQDRQVKVDLQPQFIITYYEKPDDIDHTAARYSKTLSDYNALHRLKMQLKPVVHEAALTDEQADFHFASIDEYSLAIDRNPENVDAVFGRALDFMVVQDLTEAIEDYTRVITLAPDFLPAYFNRAAVRYKKMEIENFGKTDDSNIISLNLQRTNRKNAALQKSKTVETPQTITSDNAASFNWEQIIRDYSTVIQINPDFVFAWYNRGNIRCAQKDFRAAISDYNEAIERNQEFAEAWFNRGLSRLYTGDTERGIADLSRAGELGIAEAYSIIKKMTAE